MSMTGESLRADLVALADEAYAYGCGHPEPYELGFAAGVEALARWIAGDSMPDPLARQLFKILPAE